MCVCVCGQCVCVFVVGVCVCFWSVCVCFWSVCVCVCGRCVCLFVIFYIYPAAWGPKSHGSGCAAAPQGAAAGFSRITFSYPEPACAVMVRCSETPSPHGPPNARKTRNIRQLQERKRKEKTESPIPYSSISMAA